jgi:cytochrome c553
MGRTIRHGVAADGRALVIMPSSSYSGFSDRDIGEIVAFLETLPPVNRTMDPPRFGPMARVAAAMAGGEVVPATGIDHEAAHPDPVPRTISVDFGAYLAKGCKGCHGPDLSGTSAGMGADVAAANLTPHAATGLGNWSLEDFDRAIRSGRRPDGSGLSTEMPWAALSALNEVEVEALWMYLRSLPPVEADRRSG